MEQGVVDGSLKAKLRARQTLIGVGLSMGCLRSVELVSRTQFDFAMIDTQHGHFDKPGATDAIRSIAFAHGPCPLARVSMNEAGPVNDLLDAGALGIVIPMLESASEAEAAVRHVFYPPLGRRSKGSLAPAVHGPRYAGQANASIALIVMIESPEGVSRASEILSVKGIDACLIGSSDLAFAMQTTKGSPELQRSIDRVVDAATASGIAAGINVGSAAEVERWVRRGLSFFLASHDLALLSEKIQAFDASFAGLRTGR